MTGRNELCPCGSGKQFKRCHGDLSGHKSDPESIFPPMLPPTEEFQRRRQQGLGRPVISMALRDMQVVAVYDRLFHGRWKTFHDFLLHYVRIVLGEAWGNLELKKPFRERHPIADWHELTWKSLNASIVRVGEINKSSMTGAISAYMRLAYDLYTLEHNKAQTSDRAIQAKLIARLKHPDQFVGARHEIRVAATFLRAGFTLDWEDEDKRDSSHCEFNATYPATGRTFGVECKVRQPADQAQPSARLGKFVGLLVKALGKQTTFARVVFVELNTPAFERRPRTRGWHEWALGKLHRLESDASKRFLPAAYVFISNYPDHHHLESAVPAAEGVVEGFKIPDFRSGHECTLREAIAARERHTEMHALMSSMEEHTDIPATFDGSIPGMPATSRRFLLGKRYLLPDNKSGTLTGGMTNPKGQTTMLVMRHDDGKQGMYEAVLTDSELATWRRYPETFFGGVQNSGKEARDPLELYDFFFKTYSNSPKEKLLELMDIGPENARLQSLSQEELARLYCEGLVHAAVKISGTG